MWAITPGRLSAEATVAAALCALRDGVDRVVVREPAHHQHIVVEGILEYAPPEKVCWRLGPGESPDRALSLGVGLHLAKAVEPGSWRAAAPFVSTGARARERLLAVGAWADRVLVSPVFAPLSKARHSEALGYAGLERLVRESPVPVLALGGVTAERAPGCIAAGCVGVAGIHSLLGDGASTRRQLIDAVHHTPLR